MENLEKVMTFLFTQIWNILSIKVPGFDFSFGDMWISFGVIYLSIFIFHMIFLKNG